MSWRDGPLRLVSLRFLRPGVSKEVTRDNAEAFGRRLIEEVSDILRIDTSQLGPMTIEEDSERKMLLRFRQEMNGVPVEGHAEVEVLRRAMFASPPDTVEVFSAFDPNADASVATVPKITRDEAVQVAEEDYRLNERVYHAPDWWKNRDTDCEIVPRGKERLIIHRPWSTSPAEGNCPQALRLCWRLNVRDIGYFIDAGSGEVIEVFSIRCR